MDAQRWVCNQSKHSLYANLGGAGHSGGCLLCLPTTASTGSAKAAQASYGPEGVHVCVCACVCPCDSVCVSVCVLIWGCLSIPECVCVCVFPSVCLCLCLCVSLRRAWQPTPVFLPGESHGQKSLASYSPWGHKESDTTEVTEHACSMCVRPCVSPTPVCPDFAGGVLCLCVSELVMTTYFPVVSM